MRVREGTRLLHLAARYSINPIAAQLRHDAVGQTQTRTNLIQRSFQSQAVPQQGLTSVFGVINAYSSFATRPLLLPSRLIRAQATRQFAAESTGSSTKLQEARSKVQSIMAAPARTVQSSATTVFKQMPRPAQRWVDRIRKPGGFQKAVTLQLEGLWHAHKRKVIGVAAVFGMYLLWRTLFGVTSIFVNLSETMAEFGFLALAAAIVAFTILYFRRLYTIDPSKVYRRAMVALQTNPGVLEVMGAPLIGSDLRASVLTGGGVRFKGWWPRYRPRRVQMIFPLKGTDKRGLVSLEAKKRQGRYSFKLLAVDVPAAEGSEQRLFVDGDNSIYSRGGVMSELRDPFLRAISMQHTYEAEDEADEAAEEAAEAQEQRVKDAQQVSNAPEPHDGGLYFSQRVALQAQKLTGRSKETKATPVKQSSKVTVWDARS